MRFIFLVYLVLLPLNLANAEPTQVESAPDCLFDGLVPENIQCEMLKVKSNHFASSNDWIDLPYLIINPQISNPMQSPIVFLSGGPGVSTGIHNRETVVWWKDFAKRIAPNRKFVVLELRGSRNSQPSLDCPELYSPTIALNVSSIQIDSGLRTSATATAERTCLTRLKKEGRKLSSVNRLQIAHDVNALTYHLGETRISLIGVSYGTTYAMTVVAEFPKIVDAMILDSVFPPEATNDIYETLHLSNTLEAIFNECANQFECHIRYPNLKDRFYEFLEELNENPLELTIEFGDQRIERIARIDSLTFVNLLSMVLGWPGFLEQLPELVANRNMEVLNIWVQIYADYGDFDHFSHGAFMSGNCFDLPLHIDREWFSGELSLLRRREIETWRLEYCDDWNEERAGSKHRQQLVTDIPTLILSSKFDPATPPRQARIARNGFSNSFLFEFPGGVHGLTSNDECAQKIAEKFLADPTNVPSLNCYRNYRSFRFETEF